MIDEVLILLAGETARPPDDPALRELLGSRGGQVFGPRVVVVGLPHGERAAAAALPGVVGIHTGPITPDAAWPEDATGRAAILAWNARHGDGATTFRRGEGLTWDDPDFEREGHPPHR